jgi:hypothetical protein
MNLALFTMIAKAHVYERKLLRTVCCSTNIPKANKQRQKQTACRLPIKTDSMLKQRRKPEKGSQAALQRIN